MPEIDKQIGEMVKRLRTGLGFSQIELAERIGISFQQVQKYEKGATRISVYRLGQLAAALGVEMAELLRQPEAGSQVSAPAPNYGSAGGPPPRLSREETLLLKLFRQVGNRKIREGILQQLRGAAELEKTTRSP